MTNYEYIRNMPIEKMAEFLKRSIYYEDDTTPYLHLCIDGKYTDVRWDEEKIIKWLNSEDKG